MRRWESVETREPWGWMNIQDFSNVLRFLWENDKEMRMLSTEEASSSIGSRFLVAPALATVFQPCSLAMDKAMEFFPKPLKQVLSRRCLVHSGLDVDG